MPTQKSDKSASLPSTWIQLRSAGHLQGRLEIETLHLEIVKSGWLTIYDLKASSGKGKAVIVERRQITSKK